MYSFKLVILNTDKSFSSQRNSFDGERGATMLSFDIRVCVFLFGGSFSLHVQLLFLFPVNINRFI